MTPARQAFKIGSLATMALVLLAMTARGQSFSLYSGKNMIPTNAVTLYGSEPAIHSTWPTIGKTNVPLGKGVRQLMREVPTNSVSLIQFDNVPITIALENLARQGGFNYMLDPEIEYGKEDNYGQRISQPAITLLLTNTTPEKAFISICAHNGLAVTGNPMTTVFIIGFRVHVLDVTAEIYANDPNAIPLIEFKDVPLSVALKNLAQQAQLKCIFDPRIDPGDPDNEPSVNLRLQNITASQAFAAICESYDLDVIKSPVSDYVRVEPN